MYFVKYREITLNKRPRMVYHRGEFDTREKARNWCRNHSWHEDLTIVHPDGRREKYIRHIDE